MCKLTLKETGFHFSARTTTETKLKDFDVQVMSNKMQSLAPGLCKLFDVLLIKEIGLVERLKQVA